MSPTPLSTTKSLTNLQTVRQKRCSPLEMSVKEIKHSTPSQVKQSYLAERGLWECDGSVRRKIIRATKASKSVPRVKNKIISKESNSDIGKIEPKLIKSRQIVLNTCCAMGTGSPQKICGMK